MFLVTMLQTRGGKKPKHALHCSANLPVPVSDTCEAARSQAA